MLSIKLLTSSHSKQLVMLLSSSMLVLVLTVFTSTILARPVLAVSTTNDLTAIINGTPYYDPSATGSSCSVASAGAAGAPGNSDYAGKAIFNDAQLQKIKENQPFYESSAKKSDIPWQMLAVIHMREHGLQRDNPSNGQGIYQFADQHGGPYPTGPVSDSEFQRQTDLAAQFIKGTVRGSKSLSADNPDLNVVKDTFWGYNGRAGVYATQAAALGFDKATQGFEGSPYVMNRADLRRDPTVEPTKSNNTWGQVKHDNGPIEYPANSDYGAFVQFAALAGIALSGGSCGGLASGQATDRIVAIAKQELALWKDGTLKPGTDYHKYSQGRNENWCADFASWVYNQAGVPLKQGGGGSVGAVDDVRQIGVQRGTYHDKSGYTPKPGDIVVREGDGSNHVNIVTSVQGNNMHVIGGNQGGGTSGFDTSKVTEYDDTLGNSDITGYVSPFGG